MKSLNQLVAFDYKAQQWRRGEPARALLIAQGQEDLNILRSARAGEYLAMVGSQLTPAQAVAKCQQGLAELAAIL